MQSTSIRIDRATHISLKTLAERLDLTLRETVALAVRRLRQDHIGKELTSVLTQDETKWLSARFR